MSGRRDARFGAVRSGACAVTAVIACAASVAIAQTSAPPKPPGAAETRAAQADGTATRGATLAARYPGDVGIAQDTAVLFAENFEAVDLPQAAWEKPGGFYDLKGHPALMHATTTEAAVGARSLELVHPQGVVSPQWLHRKFPGQDTVYTRFYRKFEKEWAWAPMGMHDTLLFAGDYKSPTTTDLSLYVDLSALDSAFNRRLCDDPSMQTRQPFIVLRSALQGPEGTQAGLDFGLKKAIVVGDDFSHYYGAPFNKAPAPVLEGGRWYCIESMAKMNSTPDARDGAVRLWVDGMLVTELTGLTLRNAAHKSIQWDHWMLGPRYGGPAFTGGPVQSQRSWIDAIVVATSRVGPVVPKK